MTREDEVRQELLRMIEDDLENEPERNPHAWLRQTRQAGREYGHMYRSEVGDFVTGRMEADRAADLSDHVAGCERCRALVERERSDREEIARYDQQRARQLEQEAITSTKRKWIRPVPTFSVLAVSGIAALLLIWFFHSYVPSAPERTAPQPYIAQYPEKDKDLPSQPTVAVQIARLPGELKQMLTENATWRSSVSSQLADGQQLLGQNPSEGNSIKIEIRNPVGTVVVDLAHFAWELLNGVHVEKFEITCIRLDPQSRRPTTQVKTMEVSGRQTTAAMHLEPGEYLWSVSAIQSDPTTEDGPRSKISRFYVLSQKDGTSPLALATANLRMGNFAEARRHFDDFRSQQERFHNTTEVRQADQWLRRLDQLQ